MIRYATGPHRAACTMAVLLFLSGCTESRQTWPPFCQIQSLDGPGRLAGHHFVENDPWPLTTGRYDYLDYLGLDEQGRARIQATSGDIKALGFIGGVGAGTADLDTVRVVPGSPPHAIHERLCAEVLNVVPDGQGGHRLSYRLTQRDPDGSCRPCP